MFKIFKAKPKTTAEHKLDHLREILFPPFKKETLPNGDKILIDYSIDSNLGAALSDLEEGNNDEVSRKTISRAIDRLIDCRRILEAYGEMDVDAKYVIVDDFGDKNAEDIEVGPERRH